MQRWWTDVKSGELGSLPIVVGLIIIAIIFQTQNDRFLTASNFVNLLVQTAPLLGALVMLGIDNGLGLSSGTKFVLTGGVLLLAVSVDSISRRGREASGRA